MAKIKDHLPKSVAVGKKVIAVDADQVEGSN